MGQEESVAKKLNLTGEGGREGGADERAEMEVRV